METKHNKKIKSEENKILLDDSEDNLIFKESISSSIISHENSSLIINFKNKCLKYPFILYFLVLISFLSIAIIIYYIYFITTEEPNFKIFDRNWIIPKLNDRGYQNYLFNNGLEVMLINDPNFDKDGGAIVIEKGYLDNPYEEGLSTFSNYLLSYINFHNEPNNINILEDYFGNFKYGTDETFINFRFDILNYGFKTFLGQFSSILDFRNITNINDFNITKNKIINEIESDYLQKIVDITYRENHLLEFLVYGLKNDNGEEILPEGNFDKLKDINIEQISKYIKKLIVPSKIKIVLFSKYKFSLFAKYMKYYFKYLINKENEIQKYDSEKEYLPNDFNTSQIFYIKANYYEKNYIKIIYYINKVNNESYSELYYKQNYFKYISDFISKTKNGSLYSIINKNIKSIYSETEIIFKSKIKFSIIIELNSLKNINDIIYTTYRYIYKITNETNRKIIQMDRYKELKDIYRNDANLKEKSFDTIALANANAQQLIMSKYDEYYYFFYDGVPWNDNINNTEEIIKNEIESYFKQLRPNNSIIILAIRDKDKSSLTCNNNSKFYLNCDYLFSNISNKTYYYDVDYKNDIFNSTKIEEYLNEELNDDFDINFERNKYKSKYKEPEEKTYKKNQEMIILDDNTTLNKFYYKKNYDFKIQKVLIKLNLYHPFLRPNNTIENDKNCYYFLILEMFSAIKRKINENLSDALLANNEIKFDQNENSLYILLTCFSDQAYNIIKSVKNIIYDINWSNETDFLINNEIYKNETFDDFFNYYKNDFQEISRFYFKKQLKNNLFNKYEFFKDDFENNYYNECISKVYNNSDILLKELSSFIIHGYIYGFYEEEDANKIYQLFNYSNINITNDLLHEVNIQETSAENFVDWMKSINDISDNETNITINPKLYNKSENGNIGTTYRLFKSTNIEKFYLNISIFQSLINGVKKNETFSLINNEMMYYKKLFFELIFTEDSNNITIQNKTKIAKEWNNLLDLCKKEFNNQVDNIGNRYYYMIKNFALNVNTTQTSLSNKGLEEIELKEYEGNILDRLMIIDEYKEKYDNNIISETELDETINYYEKKLDNSKCINIFVGNETEQF